MYSRFVRADGIEEASEDDEYHDIENKSNNDSETSDLEYVWVFSPTAFAQTLFLGAGFILLRLTLAAMFTFAYESGFMGEC